MGGGGGKGGGGDMPDAPDFMALAREQAGIAGENWQKALTASRPNQIGPEGNLKWVKDDKGNWTQTVEMAPERQSIWDQLQGKTLDQLKGYGTGQIDLSGAPPMPEVGGYNQQAIDAIRALQQPGMERARAAKEAQLAAMGLGTGSGSAWDAEQRNLGNMESDADMKAILAGINQGNVEFGQGMQRHTVGTGDILGQEQANLAKMGGLMALGNSFRLPSFQGFQTPGQSEAMTPNLMGAAQAAYKAAMDQYNAEQSEDDGFGSILGAFGSAAGNAFGGPIGGAIGGKIGGMIGGGGGGGFGGWDFGLARPDMSGFTW